MNPSVSALLACLEKEISLTGEFLAILRDEAAVLEDGATETSLADTTARKNAAADALGRVARERNALLDALGCEHDGPGLQAAADAHPSLSGPRLRLLDITGEARTLNESNGRIIDVFLDHNQRTLDTLRRLAGVGDIYDASGRTRSGNKGSGRNIKA
ncbi:flagellar protein FlgN [Alcaligenaceae bacterium]|nr:flagellar protein FlgN [Alcaligenaceae bacterium]